MKAGAIAFGVGALVGLGVCAYTLLYLGLGWVIDTGEERP